jgi:hypothetical protein
MQPRFPTRRAGKGFTAPAPAGVERLSTSRTRAMIAVPITFDADPMSENELQQKLEKLRAEIEKVASNDTEARERMNALLGEVEKTLAASGEEVDENLLENIREAVSQFETDHPRATAILNDIMVTLSNMGI